ncbi:MAG: alpha/beta hydrolase [Bacteroidota bacterium]
MTVYFISGLGADERAFRYIRLPEVETRFICWMPPRKREPLRQYASRLLDQIDTSQPTVLVGLSFGGIIAQELASMIDCIQVFLISSVKHPREFSPLLQFVKRSRIYKFLPFRWVKPIISYMAPYWFNAASGRQRTLLRSVINETDNQFAQWAIETTMRWAGQTSSAPVIQLHGSHDRIFPVRYLGHCFTIERAGHFMVVTHAKKVSKLIGKHLNQEQT